MLGFASLTPTYALHTQYAVRPCGARLDIEAEWAELRAQDGGK
jgi:hypothetical protein